MGSNLTLVSGDLSFKLVLQELIISYKLLLEKNGQYSRTLRSFKAVVLIQEIQEINLRNLKFCNLIMKQKI